MRRIERSVKATDGAETCRHIRAPIQTSSLRGQSRLEGGVRKRVTRRCATRCASIPSIRKSTEDSAVIRGRSDSMVEANVSSEVMESPKCSHEADLNSPREPVVLQGTIPDVLEWTRGIMDEKNVFCSHRESNEAEDGPQPSTPREFARRLHSVYKFRIITNDGNYWKSEVRLWENICALSSRLPGEGKSSVIFEAMRRYPSSALVHHGLKIVFGRQMIIGSRRIPRLPISQNAVALFSPTVNNRKSIKEWFEDDTHVRLQETVIHMCAVSEYILRCAYIAKQQGNPSNFPSLIEERIQTAHDDRKRKTLGFQPWNILMDLSEDNASACLESAMAVSHKAVIIGARAAYKRHGRKSVLGREREKIKLCMLQQPLKDIMDQVIYGIERVVETVVGAELDLDFFRLHATRALRKVASIYEDVGSMKFEAKKEVPCNVSSTEDSPMYPTRYVFTPQT